MRTPEEILKGMTDAMPFRLDPCFKPYILEALTIARNEALAPPTKEEIESAVEVIAMMSTAPDKETPDWMKADIKAGINWGLKQYESKVEKYDG